VPPPRNCAAYRRRALTYNRPLLNAALRVLSSLAYRTGTTAIDIDVLRSNALPGEIDLELDFSIRAMCHQAVKVEAAADAAVSRISPRTSVSPRSRLSV
jgi:hypothetical protein